MEKWNLICDEHLLSVSGGYDEYDGYYCQKRMKSSALIQSLKIVGIVVSVGVLLAAGIAGLMWLTRDGDSNVINNISLSRERISKYTEIDVKGNPWYKRKQGFIPNCGIHALFNSGCITKENLPPELRNLPNEELAIRLYYEAIVLRKDNIANEFKQDPNNQAYFADARHLDINDLRLICDHYDIKPKVLSNTNSNIYLYSMGSIESMRENLDIIIGDINKYGSIPLLYKNHWVAAVGYKHGVTTGYTDLLLYDSLCNPHPSGIKYNRIMSVANPNLPTSATTL